MKKLVVTILLILPFTLFGQVEEWSQTFDVGYSDYTSRPSVTQTTDGGYIIFGSETIGDDTGMVLIKTDQNGQELWRQSVTAEYGYSVEQTIDGGYVITGHGGYLIKTDQNGQELWNKTILGTGYSVQQSDGGGYVIVGNTNQPDICLIKTDENGQELWVQSYPLPGLEFGYSFKQTTDGGYIISGILDNSPCVLLIIKTDGGGQELWRQTFPEATWFMGYGETVQQTGDGGYIVVGSGGGGVYLFKTDGNGQELWSQSFLESQSVKGESVQQTSDEGYLVMGSVWSYDNDGNVTDTICLIKVDESGEELWTQNLGVGKSHTMKRTNDGGYVIVGYKNSNIFLIKLSNTGDLVSTTELPLISPTRKLHKTIDILGREVKREPNLPLIEIYDDGSVEKRIIID